VDEARAKAKQEHAAAKMDTKRQRVEVKRQKGEARMARRRAYVRPSQEQIGTLLATRPVPSDPSDLQGYAMQSMSQHGEAGIVYEVLRRLDFPTRVSVEIGCGSNGGNSGLLACLGYRALMLDGNAELTAIARDMFEGLDVSVVNTWVSRETINDTLREHGFTGPVDYLGVDLDGVDYWIWEAIEAVQPLLVVCEHNRLFGPTARATVPYSPTFDRKAPGTPKGYYGVSLAGATLLAQRLGYRLVATHHDNAFYLRHDLCPELRTITPAEGWTMPAKPRRARYVEPIQEAGVFEYFERQGHPLVDLGKHDDSYS
jgi:hypothetical protein